MARRQAEQHRARESPRSSSATTARSPVRRPPARRSAAARRRRAPTARDRMPLRHSCVSMRSSRYGRSATSSRNSTQPGGGSNAYGVPSEAQSWVSVPPTSMPAASPGCSTSTCGCEISPAGSARHRHARERVAIVARLPAREAPFEHRAVERRRCRTCSGQPREQRGVVAVADERLRRRRQMSSARAAAAGARCRSRRGRR